MLLKKYDASKVETVKRTIMKQLTATVSKQRGILYEFGPEYEEYCAKKAAGILDAVHIKPLSETFAENQLEFPLTTRLGKTTLVR